MLIAKNALKSFVKAEDYWIKNIFLKTLFCKCNKEKLISCLVNKVPNTVLTLFIQSFVKVLVFNLKLKHYSLHFSSFNILLLMF